MQSTKDEQNWKQRAKLYVLLEQISFALEFSCCCKSHLADWQQQLSVQRKAAAQKPSSSELAPEAKGSQWAQISLYFGEAPYKLNLLVIFIFIELKALLQFRVKQLLFMGHADWLYFPCQRLDKRVEKQRNKGPQGLDWSNLEF
ncbi:hypothetical protein E5288_WYG006591 [Bos mutus]|uniref:Uncharacterized protein n=1 Tax=Bos mutus TaxID=72004 RepID=A0A6B0RDR0_9CETA|nr:hypothetical protein [Bos mutus]